MTSGAIQEYVPAADIFVVLCHSRAKPKSVIFKVFLPISSFSIVSSNKTEKRGRGEGGGINYSGVTEKTGKERKTKICDAKCDELEGDGRSMK